MVIMIYVYPSHQPVLCVLVTRLPTSSALFNLRHAAFPAVPIFIPSVRPVSLYCAQYVDTCTHIWHRTDCIRITVVTK